MTDQSPHADRRFATTLARGLSVLRAFRPSDDGLSNAEIAERTGLPKSTVSRLTFTLQSLGYLTHGRLRDRYRPGPALLALGNVAGASISFIDICAPIMQRLADETGTLALLAMRDTNKVLLAKTFRPVDRSSIWLEVGHRLPFRGTSSGHCLIGATSEDALPELVSEVDGDRGLDLATAREIRADARDQMFARGFVITEPAQYFSGNIHAVSTPFQPRDIGGPVVFTCGALPVDLPVERMETEVGPALRVAVKELEQRLGMPPSPLPG
ncbi:IclR family transcriptional regulator [Palleronia pelagia]|uniref:DNA-binding transcriptional regulator, IclR family n=1 Tax=Palleronia pelagia TaxID=387096 RepID=A0A1H8DUM8_9RHOB|nr:IclR family transcriptional regulator [Palleronia pelagia]SEN10913.1 DNA-binding transcriptional regulator, IclR family [Palleronia pelagia]